ncbi:MAG: VWA domain-containing protein [Candidatus Acidiferrales bacterium]
MRPTTIAAGILALALAAFPAFKSMARAAADSSQQAGPMRRPSAGNQSQAAVQQQQEQQSPPQEQRPLQVQVSIVNVFATVRDKHHAIVDNLTKDDFQISEDGQEQKVAFFSKEVDMPITLGMLMDTSYSMYHILDAEKSAASRFLKEVMRKRDEAMVISFDTDVNLLADFTEDTSVLDQAIDRTAINVDASGIGGTPGTIASSNGGTDLYDAIYLACHDQMASEAGRKALILLTDAEDTGSKMSEQDAIEAAQRADAVIHVLLIRDRSATMGYGGGVANRMAEQTGGRVIDVRNEDSLEKAFDEISEELRSQYVLGYYPTNTKRDGTFRKIQVKVDQPDVKVLARRGYYAPRH